MRASRYKMEARREPKITIIINNQEAEDILKDFKSLTDMQTNFLSDSSIQLYRTLKDFLD